MKIFRLPDLGEGLPDAIVREWFIKEGDTVSVDQPIVAMETAKALVDVPSPFDGKIEKFFGQPGDTIHTGEPLIGFEGESTEGDDSQREDTGTVVGNIQTTDTVISDDTFSNVAVATKPAASPAVRALARRRGVDLSAIATKDGRIQMSDVKAAPTNKVTTKPAAAPLKQPVKIKEGYTQLSPVRRAMTLSMSQSHSEVVPVTLNDDADIHAWFGQQNVTMRVLRAVTAACISEPMLNAFFDGSSMSYKFNDTVNIGLAIDTKEGLFVPVLKDIANTTDEALRAKINTLKEQAQTKSIPQSDLQGATIILSNFGTIAGRYANPILLPPMTAIVGVGKLRDAVVSFQDNIVVHKTMPLSVTMDHRAVTGGETARFLKTMIEALEK